jgi:streptogramin lyase
MSLAATATNSSGIALAAGTAANLVDPVTGAVPGSGFPATGLAPVKKINSLANLLNGCVVSNGAGSPACQQLFTAAYGPAGKGSYETSGETFGAVISLATNAAENVAELYTLSQASHAYEPVLGAAPADWTLLATYGGGGMNTPSAVSIDSTGRVWVANYFEVASLFTNTGEPVFGQGITGDHLDNSYGGAVDVNDSFWVVNEESGQDVNGGLGSISVLSSTGALEGHYIAGGIDFPLGAAFDTSGVAWVVDYGDSQITLLDGSGNPLSGLDGYMAKNFVFPVAVATDAKCNAYVANQSSNTVTLVIADGSSFTDYVVGDGPSGVAIDTGGNVWSANFYRPQGIAADGAGTVWVGNYRAAGLTELAGASTSMPGAVLSPSMGWATDSGMDEAFGLAIDASGNVWITDAGNNTLNEFVGLAVPVQTPLLGPVRVP